MVSSTVGQELKSGTRNYSLQPTVSELKQKINSMFDDQKNGN